jgi:hypothetical protein
MMQVGDVILGGVYGRLRTGAKLTLAGCGGHWAELIPVLDSSPTPSPAGFGSLGRGER